jgi:RNA polymerase sigma factor for flagellar operon FliA
MSNATAATSTRAASAPRPATRRAGEAPRPVTDERERKIIELYPVVRAIATRMAQRFPSHDADDFANVGVIGLMDAIDRFDPSRGVPFRAYAEIRIRGAIVDALREDDWAPRTLRRSSSQLSETRTRLSHRLGREPSREEMAQELGITPAAYDRKRADSTAHRVVSLDAPTNEDSDSRLVDQLPGETATPLDHRLLSERNEQLEAALHRLPDREREVVAGYYLGGRSLKEIGETLGVTESRACQLRGQALQRLRRILVEEDA